MNEAWEIEYIIRDDEGNHLIHRSIQFPFALDLTKLDDGIADLLLRLAGESEDEPNKRD